MNSLGELIAAFRSDELKLPALFDALVARGPISDDVYARERAVLERLKKDRGFNPEIAQALLAKLESLRAQAGAGCAADQDLTAVRPAGARIAQGDATVVQPVSKPQPQEDEPQQEGATVVCPASQTMPVQQEDADTRARSSLPPIPDAPAVGDAGPDTGGSSTSGSGSSGWERVATATQGESATVGMLLKGRFLLEREIGRGGMGVVFVARDERKVEARDRDPYVAVKV
ncbi:MAG TPA: protein kinase, partial [Rhodanobacteraceae bacterium]